MDGWNTTNSFLLGPGLFAELLLLVSGRVYTYTNRRHIESRRSRRKPHQTIQTYNEFFKRSPSTNGTRNPITTPFIGVLACGGKRCLFGWISRLNIWRCCRCLHDVVFPGGVAESFFYSFGTALRQDDGSEEVKEMNFDIRCLLTWPQLSTIYVHEFDEKHGKLFKQINSKEIAQAFWGVFLASSGFRGFFQVYIGFR